MLCLTYKIKSQSIDDSSDILISYYSVNANKICPKILPRIIKRFSWKYPRQSIIYAKLDDIQIINPSDFD